MAPKAVVWSDASEKLLLCSALEVATFGEIPGQMWELIATRMGGAAKGFTADKVSQRYNKTLKGGEVVTGNTGADEFLTGEKLLNKKVELGVMTEEEKKATLERSGKKGAAGLYIRQAFIMGKDLVDDDMVREAQMKKKKTAAKKAATADEEDSTLEGTGGKKKRGAKRGVSTGEGEGESGSNGGGGTLGGTGAVKKRRTSRAASTVESETGSQEVKEESGDGENLS